MTDKLMQDAEGCYQRFKDAQAENDFAKSRTAAREVLAAIERIKSDPKSATFVPDAGERINRISMDAAWQQNTEKDVRDYLERNQ